MINVPYSRNSKDVDIENSQLTTESPQDVNETVRKDSLDPDVEINESPNETVQQCQAQDSKFNVPVDEDTTLDPNQASPPKDKNLIEKPVTETELYVVSHQELPQDNQRHHTCDDVDNCEPKPQSALSKKERKNVDNVKIKTSMKRDVSKEKPTPVSPLAELHELGKCLGGTEGGPPFNFQKMLRKTNFQRDSLKRAVEKLKGTSEEGGDVVKEDEKKEIEILACETNTNIINDINNQQKERRTDISFAKIISTEISPGITLEGVLFEI